MGYRYAALCKSCGDPAVFRMTMVDAALRSQVGTMGPFEQGIPR